MSVGGSAIRVFRDASSRQVEYRRLELGSLLTGMDVDAALALVAKLLPICAQAQHVAGARAVEAARGVEESAGVRAEREHALLREQAQAATWRLLVDWPRAVNLTPDLRRLKALRNGNDEQLADGLRGLLPAALRGENDWEDRHWIDRCLTSTHSDSPLVAERILHRATGNQRQIGQRVTTLCGGPLFERAQRALASPSLNRAALRTLSDQTTDKNPITVGPLAMARHVGSETLRGYSQDAALPSLFMAALLDTRYLVERLQGASTGNSDLAQRNPGPGVGIGHAMTARGPLLHRVLIDDEQRVQHWQYLAPTDWHFAPGGLVARAAHSSATDSQLRLLITAADPCAAWELGPGAGREAA